MNQTHQAAGRPRFVAVDMSLREQIAEAVRDRTTPLSQLLRLMSALDASDDGDEALRLQLRARIGAPRDA